MKIMAELVVGAGCDGWKAAGEKVWSCGRLPIMSDFRGWMDHEHSRDPRRDSPGLLGRGWTARMPHTIAAQLLARCTL